MVGISIAEIEATMETGWLWKKERRREEKAERLEGLWRTARNPEYSTNRQYCQQARMSARILDVLPP